LTSDASVIGAGSLCRKGIRPLLLVEVAGAWKTQRSAVFTAWSGRVNIEAVERSSKRRRPFHMPFVKASIRTARGTTRRRPSRMDLSSPLLRHSRTQNGVLRKIRAVSTAENTNPGSMAASTAARSFCKSNTRPILLIGAGKNT
jgi:hypothetical protein